MLICKLKSKIDYLGLIYRIDGICKTAITIKGKQTIYFCPALFCDELRLGNLRILEI